MTLFFWLMQLMRFYQYTLPNKTNKNAKHKFKPKSVGHNKIHKIFHNIPKQSHYEVTGN